MDIKVGDIFVERSRAFLCIRVITARPKQSDKYFTMTCVRFGCGGELSSVDRGHLVESNEFDTMKYGFKVEEPKKCASEPSS